MIGKKLSPILEEIENTIWEFEANKGGPPLYTDDGFRASLKIFMSTMIDKMYLLQKKEGIKLDDNGKMAFKLGEEIKKLVKTYTNIDTYELYKKG